MFEICSHSAGRRLSLFCVALAVLFALSALFFTLLSRPRPLDNAAGRCAYLAACGWTADPASEDAREIELPAEFDPILERYNALQIAQGFDLRAAAGERCLRCSYDLVDYPGWEGRVIATLYLYHGRVIGGDVHTASAEGFMHALRRDS